MNCAELGKEIINRLLFDYTYAVAFKKISDKEYTLIPADNRYSYADPFVVEHNGKTAIFVELMDYHRVWGCIGAAEITNGKATKFRSIIQENYHMSFPNVFELDGELYMIPETYNTGDVHLYKCIEFPYKWEKSYILIEGVKLVDHAVYCGDKEFIVISYDLDLQSSRCFCLNTSDFRFVEIFPQGNFCKERPGGTFYRMEDKVKRVIQDCNACYGDFIRIYDVKTINEREFNEVEEKIIKIDNLAFNINKNYVRTHAYDRSEHYEVVDVWYKKFYINKLLRSFVFRIIHPDRKCC